MSWSARRRFLILAIVIVVIGGLAFWHYSPVIFQAPTCSDGVKNGDELGVDCGGSMCSNLCQSEVSAPVVLWSRSFIVAGNVYNAAAYIENKNDAAVQSYPYEFRLYDAKGILIARRDGTTVVPPLGRYAIIETGIDAGTGVVTRTTFEFTSAPVTWYHVPTPVENTRLVTSKMAFDTSAPVPRLSATLTNPSTTIALEDTMVAAVLYDANDNAVNVSRTIVSHLNQRASVPVVFTWPTALTAPVVRYEILPTIDVFRAH